MPSLPFSAALTTHSFLFRSHEKQKFNFSFLSSSFPIFQKANAKRFRFHRRTRRVRPFTPTTLHFVYVLAMCYITSYLRCSAYLHLKTSKTTVFVENNKFTKFNASSSSILSQESNAQNANETQVKRKIHTVL